jgi:hypothetical protein
MQIIIDIPGIMYDWFENGFPDDKDAAMLWEVVREGTKLPKTYGRLVDANAVIKSLMAYLSGDKTIGQCIDDTPTIVEAKTEADRD